MRRLLLFAFLPAALGAAPALQIVRPAISQMDGGTPDPPGFEHVAGETIFFSCRVSGFARTEDQKIRLAYSVQAFDPKGVPAVEKYSSDITEELTPQDKDWLPKIEAGLALPPLAPPGEYKVVVKVEDLVAKVSTELATPFRVRGKAVEPSDTLTIRNFRFLRAENEVQPMAKAAYKAGDELWARFDITGYKYGEKNKIDVSYLVSILSAGGKVLWTQETPALDQSESFYPKPYVPAVMSLDLKTVKPAEYIMAVQVKDAVGGQTYEAKQNFSVQE